MKRDNEKVTVVSLAALAQGRLWQMRCLSMSMATLESI
jgi:hypothetical protein